MTDEMRPLRRDGDRVWVASVHEADVAPYGRAVELSVPRIREWNRVHPSDLIGQLSRQSEVHRTLVVHARRPVGDHAIVGVVNVFNIVRGAFQSGTIGYNSFDPYTGTGLFAEGLRLVLALAFTAEPDGLGLHRIEANVQPANVRSAGLLRSIGFRRERHMRHMLFLEGGGRQASWRDHDSYAITAGEPPTPHRSNEHPRVVVVAGTGARRPGPAGALADELGVPLLSSRIISVDLIWQVLATSPPGAVVELDPDAVGRDAVLDGLHRADVPVERALLVGELPSDPSGITRVALQARAIGLG